MARYIEIPSIVSVRRRRHAPVGSAKPPFPKASRLLSPEGGERRKNVQQRLCLQFLFFHVQRWTNAPDKHAIPFVVTGYSAFSQRRSSAALRLRASPRPPPGCPRGRPPAAMAGHTAGRSLAVPHGLSPRPHSGQAGETVTNISLALSFYGWGVWGVFLLVCWFWFSK